MLCSPATSPSPLGNSRLSSASRLAAAAAVLVLLGPAAALGDEPGVAPQTEEKEEPRVTSALSPQPLGLQRQRVPPRPTPLLEVFPASLRGDPYLSTGELRPGYELPTGAVLQPQLVVFGTLRVAGQYFNSGPNDGRTLRTSEVASRLDLFANLRLTETERLLVGFEPLDRNGQFTSYIFEPRSERGWRERFQLGPRILFFEGDFGQIFPRLDPADTGLLDWGFAVGRQPLFLQNGILLNDNIDSLGITRNTLFTLGTSNWKTTGLVGLTALEDPGNLARDRKIVFGGLSSSIDTAPTTIDVDLIYKTSPRTGNAVSGGLAFTQRIQGFNTSLRAVASIPTERRDDTNSLGAVLMAETSWIPTGRDDTLYLNAFLGIDRFASVSRSPSVGGPLSRVGILYEAVGIGQYRSALDSFPDKSIGGALGYQLFFNEKRDQVVFELGGRTHIRSEKTEKPAAGAFGVRFQHAMGRHLIFIVDGFVGGQETVHEVQRGIRLEMATKF
jgi:hypothetical protein